MSNFDNHIINLSDGPQAKKISTNGGEGFVVDLKQKKKIISEMISEEDARRHGDPGNKNSISGEVGPENVDLSLENFTSEFVKEKQVQKMGKILSENASSIKPEAESTKENSHFEKICDMLSQASSETEFYHVLGELNTKDYKSKKYSDVNDLVKVISQVINRKKNDKGVIPNIKSVPNIFNLREVVGEFRDIKKKELEVPELKDEESVERDSSVSLGDVDVPEKKSEISVDKTGEEPEVVSEKEGERIKKKRSIDGFVEKDKNKTEKERKKNDNTIKSVVGKGILGVLGTLTGTKALADVPRYINQKIAIKGFFGKGGLENAVKDLIKKNQNIENNEEGGDLENKREKKAAEIKSIEDQLKKDPDNEELKESLKVARDEQSELHVSRGREVQNAIDKLNARLKKSKEGGEKNSVQRRMLAKILRENRAKEGLDEEALKKEISDVVDNYTTTKLEEVKVLKEVVNSAMVTANYATAGAAYVGTRFGRMGAYGALDAVSRRRRLKKESAEEVKQRELDRGENVIENLEKKQEWRSGEINKLKIETDNLKAEIEKGKDSLSEDELEEKKKEFQQRKELLERRERTFKTNRERIENVNKDIDVSEIGYAETIATAIHETLGDALGGFDKENLSKVQKAAKYTKAWGNIVKYAMFTRSGMNPDAFDIDPEGLNDNIPDIYKDPVKYFNDLKEGAIEKFENPKKAIDDLLEKLKFWDKRLVKPMSSDIPSDQDSSLVVNDNTKVVPESALADDSPVVVDQSGSEGLHPDRFIDKKNGVETNEEASGDSEGLDKGDGRPEHFVKKEDNLEKDVLEEGRTNRAESFQDGIYPSDKPEVPMQDGSSMDDENKASLIQGSEEEIVDKNYFAYNDLPKDYTVKEGDSVWKVAKNLLSKDSDFNNLNPEQQTYAIDAVKDKIMEGRRNDFFETIRDTYGDKIKEADYKEIENFVYHGSSAELPEILNGLSVEDKEGMEVLLKESLNIQDLDVGEKISLDNLHSRDLGEALEDADNLSSEQQDSIGENNDNINAFLNEHENAPRTEENYEAIVRNDGSAIDSNENLGSNDILDKVSPESQEETISFVNDLTSLKKYGFSEDFLAGNMSYVENIKNPEVQAILLNLKQNLGDGEKMHLDSEALDKMFAGNYPKELFKAATAHMDGDKIEVSLRPKAFANILGSGVYDISFNKEGMMDLDASTIHKFHNGEPVSSNEQSLKEALVFILKTTKNDDIPSLEEFENRLDIEDGNTVDGYTRFDVEQAVKHNEEVDKYLREIDSKKALDRSIPSVGEKVSFEPTELKEQPSLKKEDIEVSDMSEENRLDDIVEETLISHESKSFSYGSNSIKFEFGADGKLESMNSSYGLRGVKGNENLVDGFLGLQKSSNFASGGILKNMAEMESRAISSEIMAYKDLIKNGENSYAEVLKEHILDRVDKFKDIAGVTLLDKEKINEQL